MFPGAATENPLSRSLQTQYGFALFCAERFEEAVDQLEMVSEMRGWDTNPMLGLSYVKTGRTDEALALAARADEPGDEPAQMAYLFAVLDSTETARRYLEHALRVEPLFYAVSGIAPPWASSTAVKRLWTISRKPRPPSQRASTTSTAPKRSVSYGATLATSRSWTRLASQGGAARAGSRCPSQMMRSSPPCPWLT